MIPTQKELEMIEFYQDLIHENDDENLKDENYCIECDMQMTLIANSFYSCVGCGACGELQHFVADVNYASKVSLYKRRIYCQEKLRLLNGDKLSKSPIYNTIIKRLKKRKKPFKNVIQIKQKLKQLGYKKFYKYVYNIYFDLTGIRLIPLTSQQIDLIANQFVALEYNFKQDETHNRKNLFNYNSVISFLLKRNKIKGSKHILLPLNHLQISKQIKLL